MANDKPTSTAPGADPHATGPGQRLGGDRADFVAALGRKIVDLRESLGKLTADSGSEMARDTLRRKLHALGTGARALHFEGMARCILDTESVLERASQDGVVRPVDLETVGHALDELPALAWGAERPPSAPMVKAASDARLDAGMRLRPASVLVIGPEELADMLIEDMGADDTSFECERVASLAKGRAAALTLAPDVTVLDADLEGATEFAQQLLDDPLTETTPLVVALTPGRGTAESRLLALGATRVLTRPLLAGALRTACQEIVDARDGKTVEMTLGEPTVAQLGERLAQEVRRALVDAVDEHARGTKVKLGDGAEVWGALWGAIARVREVVTAKTGGAVQFAGGGPEGAVALAPMLTASGGIPSSRAADVGRSREEAVNVNLAGRRVLVADDDPGVTWFISDLLRTAGCVVHEALDGRTALQMAYELSPELLVSDILMPGLDGFALCRALRRDVVLRDTPVILLSWKEDLLQRVRELGASAAAYLRKESDSSAIVARVREVLRPRARIAARLGGQGEVRGRLDGLTVRTLLELVTATRPAARVSVRDASFLYEIELRGRGIASASRTSVDGQVVRGDRVLVAMLGIGAGRFSVSSTKVNPDETPVPPLEDQLAKPIALARCALHATTGARMMSVASITLDPTDLDAYVHTTPEPARALVQRLARGAAPREILLHGEASPALLEDILADLATRGAILSVTTTDGTNALGVDSFDPRTLAAEAGSSAPSPPAPAAAKAKAAPPADRPTDPGGRAEPPPAVATAAPEPAKIEPSEAQPAEAQPEDSKPAATTPRAGAADAPEETSIPLTVDPTDDLRRGLHESAPTSVAEHRRPSAHEDEPAPSSGFPRMLAVGLCTLAVVIAAIGARSWMSQHGRGSSAEPPAAPSLQVVPGVTYEAIPAGVTVPSGQGLLTIDAPEGAPIRVDGTESHQARQGKTLHVPLAPGVHVVSVGQEDRARSRVVEVRTGRATHVVADEP